jgi:hypothetical protein
MIADSWSVMSAQSYLDWFGHSMVQMLAFWSLQAPSHLRMRFDRDAILSNFSMLDENGSRIVGRPWAHGPGWTSDDCQPGVAPALPASTSDVPMQLTGSNTPLQHDDDLELTSRSFHASDDPNRRKYPFGNPNLDGSAAVAYRELQEQAARNIGIDIAVSGDGGGNFPRKRKGMLPFS